MKKKKKIIYSVLVAICLVVAGSCVDDSLFKPDSEGTPLPDYVSMMRSYFESTATTLRQIDLQRCGPVCEHEHSRVHGRSGSQSISDWQSSNLVPDWKQVRTWENDSLVYLEVPIKGDSVYQTSFLNIGRRRNAYPVRSYLVLVNDKNKEKISYHVVTAIVETHGNKKPREKDFQYVGNKKFRGFLLYSAVDGTSLWALHVKHKIHPIQIGKGRSATRTADRPSNIGSAGCGYELSLSPAAVQYSYDESGDGWWDDGNGNSGLIRCGFCHLLYDINAERCPNGCEVTINGGGGNSGGGNGGGNGDTSNDYMIYCNRCGRLYDMYYYSSCPFCNDDSSPILPPWFGGGTGGGGVFPPGGDTGNNDNDDDECEGVKCEKCGGYKILTRGTTNCPACICDYNVNLSVYPATVDLGDSYSLNIINTSGVTVSRVEYHIMFLEDISVRLPLGSATGSGFTTRAYRPGVWPVQATVHFVDGKEVETDIQCINIQNPTGTKISANSGVKAKMESLWAATISNARNGTYREKGCIIHFNTATNTYEFVDVPDSPEFVCEGRTDINFAITYPTPNYPNTGGTYVVGTFHTHPARTKCDSDSRYLVGPSFVDQAMETVCLVYDYVGTGKEVVGGHSPNDAYKIFISGLERSPIK